MNQEEIKAFLKDYFEWSNSPDQAPFPTCGEAFADWSCCDTHRRMQSKYDELHATMKTIDSSFPTFYDGGWSYGRPQRGSVDWFRRLSKLTDLNIAHFGAPEYML